MHKKDLLKKLNWIEMELKKNPNALLYRDKGFALFFLG